MKKLYSLVFAALLCSGSTIFAQFGIFATGIQISSDGGSTTQFYAVDPKAGDPNAIGSSSFGSTSLGTFTQFSSMLKITGGEIKTFKGSSGNVCGARISYRVYPTGSAGGAYKQIPLNFFANCGAGVFTDGNGPCMPGDQKWQRTGLNIDLTDYSPGTYTLELYFEAFGSATSTSACDETVVWNNNFDYYRAIFTIDGTLPVKLLNLSAAQGNQGVNLAWETALERNFKHFEVERSIDGTSFTTVATVKGKGNSVIRTRYNFVDRTAPAGTVYYRLKLVDVDGELNYTTIVNTTSRSPRVMKASPNPASSQLQLSGVVAGDRIIVTNMLGVQMMSRVANGTVVSLNVASLSKGKYFITVANEAGKNTIGFIKE